MDLTRKALGLLESVSGPIRGSDKMGIEGDYGKMSRTGGKMDRRGSE